MVVQNLDLYRQCVKEAPRRRAILADRVKTIQMGQNSGQRRRGSTSVGWSPFFSVYSRLKASTAIWYNLDYVDKEKLDERKLSSYPEMTLALRTRLIVALSIANKISCSCIITLYFSFTFFAAYYFFQIVEEFPAWYVPVVALELTYFSYMVIRILEILIFETNLASSSAILFISYIQEANVYLHEVLQLEKRVAQQQQTTNISFRTNGGGNYQHHRGPSSSGKKMADALWRFLSKHTHISHQIIYAGQEMWAAVLMISMSYHIPNNAYLMIRILLGSRTMVTWTVCIVQIVYILVTLLFLAAYSKVLHAAKNDLTDVQLLISRRHLGAKWKCLAIYELLNSGKQIGITIGPSNTITFRVVFEVGAVCALCLAFAFLKSKLNRVICRALFYY
ncbi:MAG: hypothetical protein QWI73_06735 [Alphaproteobacteria bacterium]|nr:hypothetical protein [Alphaproteobacteria bacterium]